MDVVHEVGDGGVAYTEENHATGAIGMIVPDGDVGGDIVAMPMLVLDVAHASDDDFAGAGPGEVIQAIVGIIIEITQRIGIELRISVGRDGQAGVGLPGLC